MRSWSYLWARFTLQAGKLMETIERFWETKSILGVCLGHQAICEFFGAKLRCLETVFHGIASEIELDLSSPYFTNLPARINVGRYHSWVVEPDSLTKPLLPIATDHSGEIMAVSHRAKPILGLQFHPESIMTKYGKQIVHQFINSTSKQTHYYERTEQIYP